MGGVHHGPHALHALHAAPNADPTTGTPESAPRRGLFPTTLPPPSTLRPDAETARRQALLFPAPSQHSHHRSHRPPPPRGKRHLRRTTIRHPLARGHNSTRALARPDPQPQRLRLLQHHRRHARRLHHSAHRLLLRCQRKTPAKQPPPRLAGNLDQRQS